MATTRLYLDARRKLKDGKYPVKIAIGNNGKDMMFGTGISCLPEEWNGHELDRKVQGCKMKNSLIREKYQKVCDRLIELEKSGELRQMSNKRLKKDLDEVMNGKKVEDFFTVWDCFATGIKNKRTGEIYRATRNKIAAFEKGLNFKDINLKWLSKFDNSMLDQGLSINARAIHLRNIRAVFNYAIDNDHIELNLYPFRKFKIKKQQTVKRSLSVGEIRDIMNYDGPYKEYADFFMLSLFLIGINIKDLLHVKELKNGRMEYFRAKTGRLYSIEVLPSAMNLIEKYRGKEYLLAWRERYADYRRFTFQVTQKLKKLTYTIRCTDGSKKEYIICKELTTYYARHSWATIAAYLDIPKETIAAALGHGGNSVTDVYIDFDKKKIDEANRKVVRYVMGELSD